MKTERFYNRMQAFRCPLCGAGFHPSPEGRSLVCGKGHCFDLSAKGYVNFLTSGKKQLYDQALFEARGRIFAEGFYDSAAEACRRAATECLPEREALSFLDAGCGEGFYAAYFTRAGQTRGFALDVVKEAVMLAARRPEEVGWMVADLANIPLADGSVDAVYNILTPANYREFERVLKPGGIVVKVVPGSGYLKELRHSLRGQLKKKADHDGKAADYFRRHLTLLDIRQVNETRPVTSRQREDFLRMTPMTFHLDRSKAEAFDEITVDLVVMVGRVKG